MRRRRRVACLDYVRRCVLLLTNRLAERTLRQVPTFSVRPMRGFDLTDSFAIFAVADEFNSAGSPLATFQSTQNRIATGCHPPKEIEPAMQILRESIRPWLAALKVQQKVISLSSPNPIIWQAAHVKQRSVFFSPDGDTGYLF